MECSQRHWRFHSHEQCELLHRAMLEILRRTSVRVYHAGALDLLHQADAVIAEEDRSPEGSCEALVRFPPGLVERALRQAPFRVSHCRRGSNQVVVSLEGRLEGFGPGSDGPNYLEPRSGQRRPFRIADLIDAIATDQHPA